MPRAGCQLPLFRYELSETSVVFAYLCARECALRVNAARHIPTGSVDTTIRVWDSLAIAPSTEQGFPSRARRTHIKTLTGHSRYCTALTAAHETAAVSRLARVSFSFLARVGRSHTHMSTWVQAHRPITGMTMLEDTGHLLSASLDGTLRVWNYTLGVVIKQFEHREEMRCLAYRCVPALYIYKLNFRQTLEVEGRALTGETVFVGSGLGLRSMDTNEVLVGTGDDSILVYALPEETRQSRRPSRAVTASIASDDDGDRGEEPL